MGTHVMVIILVKIESTNHLEIISVLYTQTHKTRYKNLKNVYRDHQL